MARTSRCAIVGDGNEKGARDLLGRETTDRAQRQRDLRFARQRRVTTGEDQAKPIVFDAALVVLIRDETHRFSIIGGAVDRGWSARVASQPIDRTKARRADQPRARIVWNCVGARPLLDGDGERVLHRLLGEIEVAEETDERREDASGLLAKGARQ